jgi:hypothetical protein
VCAGAVSDRCAVVIGCEEKAKGLTNRFAGGCTTNVRRRVPEGTRTLSGLFVRSLRCVGAGVRIAGSAHRGLDGLRSEGSLRSFLVYLFFNNLEEAQQSNYGVLVRAQRARGAIFCSSCQPGACQYAVRTGCDCINQ